LDDYEKSHNTRNKRDEFAIHARPLLDLFVFFINKNYKRELQTVEFMKKNIDIKFPHKWFPLARKIKRKIFYHMGPTNSGKTYEALTKLAKAKNGIYCAPLRLLAWEVIIDLIRYMINYLIKE
jgi:ATP-dependent RNA helicase SUPV3L1/SUV3